MKILIVSATLKEIEPLLNQLRYQWKVNAQVSRYLHKSTNIDVLITGIGMVSMAFQMGKILAENQYNYAINLGIAGSFKSQFQIGDLVEIREDILAELGAEDREDFIPFSEMEISKNEQAMNGGNMRNESRWEPRLMMDIPKVRAITVNKVLGSEESIEKVRKLFNPCVETMEGAAFHYSCQQNQLDAIQLRAISNKVEPRNKDNWNIPLALENLNSFAFKLIESI